MSRGGAGSFVMVVSERILWKLIHTNIDGMAE